MLSAGSTFLSAVKLIFSAELLLMLIVALVLGRHEVL